MTRDWHATYLTDTRAMDAARARSMRTGEDGWSAAYTVALTLPAAPGSHAATGARDVLVPDTLPDTAELGRLADATPTDDDEHGGYYDEPNITYDNPDMAPSMTRRARPGEVVRPDLRCPKCCQAAGEPDEDGVQEQTYRCTSCHELWTYVPGALEGSDSCGNCAGCRRAALLELMGAPLVVTLRPGRAASVVPLPLRGPAPVEPSRLWSGMRQPEIIPPAGRTWRWQPDEGPGLGSDGTPVFVDEIYELSCPTPEWFHPDPAVAEAARADGARMVAEAFGIPERVVRGETDAENRERVEREAGELLILLHDVTRGRVTATRIDEYPAAPEARRRRLLTTGGSERGSHRDYIENRRMQLTALGCITYQALRKASLQEGRASDVR